MRRHESSPCPTRGLALRLAWRERRARPPAGGLSNLPRRWFRTTQELLQASGKEHHLSFDDLDLDGSGEVTHEEIIAGLRAKLGHEPSAAMVEQFLSQVGRPRLHLP